MADDSTQDSGFKVVDRRPFSVDGTRREDVKDEASELKSEVRAAAPGPKAAEADYKQEEYLESEGSGFETLVSDLSATAMFHLGLIEGPSGERVPPDLPSARRTIDLLNELKEKTRGNLNRAESRLLENVLYQLRLTYVEVDKRGARKQK